MVGLLVAGQHAKGQVLAAGPLDLPGRDSAHAVGVEQHRHHPRIEPLLSARVLGLRRHKDLREIQLIHQVQQEIHLVVLGQPITR